MKKIKAFFAMAIALAGLSGCSSYYQIIRIPDTPEGLAGYRQCATAPHFSQEVPCMNGIPGFSTSTEEISVRDPIALETHSPAHKIGQGCRELVLDSYEYRGDTYYCSIQACPPEGTELNAPADPTDSYRDADGKLHLNKSLKP